MHGIGRMLNNTKDVIESKVPGVKVEVAMRGIIGAKPGYFEVRAKLDNPGLTCPDLIVLQYDGDLSLGAVAMQASDFLTDVVDAQVYPLEDGMADE